MCIQLTQACSLEEQVAALRAEYDRKLAEAEESKQAALEQQQVELTGTAAQRAAMAEERAREERIEQLRRQTVRRMMNAGLLNAWNAWAEFWDAKTYALQRLREVANRLRSPALSSAFAFWARDTAARLSRRSALVHEEKAKGLERENTQLRDQLTTLRASSEEQLAALSAERLGLLARVAELSGNAADATSLLEAQEEKERASRVELLTRQIGRRMLYRDVSLGFTAWVELWEAKTYATERLRQVAARLRSPELSLAFSFWAEDAAALKEAAASSGARSRAATLAIRAIA